MTKSDKKKGRKSVKRGFWKRFWRFWLFTFFIIIGTVLVSVLAVYLFFPPQAAKELAVRSVKQQLNRDLEIRDVSYNLLRGFKFSDISLTTPDSLTPGLDGFPVQSAYVKSAMVRYDIFKLIHKQAVVREIVLDSPQIDLFIPESVDTTQAKPPADSITVPVFPLAIKLDKLRLKNALFSMEVRTGTQKQTLVFSNLNLDLDHIQVPKGNLALQDSTLRGELAFRVDNGEFKLEMESDDADDMSLSGVLDLNSAVKIITLDTLNIDLSANLTKLTFNSSAIPELSPIKINEPIDLDMTGHFYLNEERFFLQDMSVHVAQQIWMRLSGFLNGITERQPYVAMKIKESNIPVSQVLDMAQSILPDSLLPDIVFTNRNAVITLSGTEVKGYIPDSLSRKGLEYTARADFLNFGMTADYGKMELQDLNFVARSTGRLRYSGLEQLQAFVDVSFGSLFYGLSDTFNVYSGHGKLDFEAELNELLVPEIININMNVNNMIGTTLNGQFVLTGTNSLLGLVGEGSLSLDGLDTKNFPQVPLSTTGRMNVELQVNTLDSIYNRIELFTDSLTVPGPFENEVFPSIRLVNEMYCVIDTTFRNIKIASLKLDLNNDVRAFASGEIVDAGKGGFSLDMSDLQLDHAALKKWLPSRKREQYRNLDLTGSTHLTANIHGSLTDSLPQYELNASLYTKNTDLLYPDQYITLRNIDVNVGALLKSDSTLLADVSLNIDSTFTDKISGSAFLNNRVACTVSGKNYQALEVMNGLISLPDLKAFGDFYVNLTKLNSNPTISAFVNFNQEAPQELSVTREVRVKGTTGLQAVVNMDTSLFDIYATLKTDNLSIYLPAETEIDNLNSDLKIHQRMDLVKGIFLQDEASQINTPSQGSIDYLTYREYYRNSLSDISYLNIDRIQAAGYELEDFELEAVLGNGRIDIPSFKSRIYEGSLGGRLSVSLAGGDLEQAEYNLSAHFSDINSDRLLPGLKRKETLGVINGNARFTGTGMNLKEKLDIGGYFYITEIGPQVADNLLRSLDPEEKDSGIQMTRTLINRGYKPRLFSFTLSHGFFATTVELSQPWYYPLKLSGSKLSLARQPVQFFIDMALAKSQAALE